MGFESTYLNVTSKENEHLVCRDSMYARQTQLVFFLNGHMEINSLPFREMSYQLSNPAKITCCLYSHVSSVKCYTLNFPYPWQLQLTFKLLR